jgi:hypothetical protein
MTAIIYLTLREYSVSITVLAGMAFFIGVLAKESVIIVAPLCYTFRAKKLIDSKAILWAIAVIAPGIIAYALTRSFIPGNTPYDSYMSLFQQIGIPRLYSIYPNDIKHYTFYTFGVSLLILPAFAPSKNLKLTMLSLPFFILVFGQLMIATSIDRLLILAFPILIIAALSGTASICHHLKIPELTGLTIPILEFLFMVLFYNSFMKRKMPTAFENGENMIVARIIVLIAGITVMFLISELEYKRRILRKKGK